MEESTALLANCPGKALRKTNVVEERGSWEGLKEYRPVMERKAPADALGVAFRQENQLQIAWGESEERTDVSGRKNNC